MAEQLNYNERRKWAEYLYQNSDISFREIALEVGIEENELRNWANKGKWEGTKRSLLTSKAHQLQLLYAQLEALNTKMQNGENKEPSPRDMDTYMKYTNAIKNLEAKISVSEIVEVFQLFFTWLRNVDLDLAKKAIVYANEFIEERLAA